jgi:superfamily II DNA or RNA helicase
MGAPFVLSTMKLRAYQKKAVLRIQQLLSEGKRPLCYAPTGAGKTAIAAELFGRVRGVKVFVVHTDQLRSQAQAVLAPVGGIVVTIQSLLLSPDMFRTAALVCFDECHHLQGQSWREAAALFGSAAMFGLSATPYASALDELFDCRYTIASVEDLVKAGHILPVTIAAPSRSFVEALAFEERIDGALAYADTYRGMQAIHFEPTVELCERAAEQYAGLGVKAAVVHGKTAPGLRETLIASFRLCQTQVLVSPVLLTEGFDAPCAQVLVAGRAFASDVLLQQAVGRIRRTHSGKAEAFVLDCTGCCADKSPAYFNFTDESKFSALPEAKAKGAARGPSQPKAAAPIQWVRCPADQWVTEAPDSIQAVLSRAENAEMVSGMRRLLDDAAKEKLHAYSRAAYAKRMQDQAKREARREAARAAQRKRLQDPSKREAAREIDGARRRRLLQDPVKRESYRAAARARHLTRMQDPVKREASRESKRKSLQNPDRRAAAREADIRRRKDPARRQALREAERARMQNPGYREARNVAKRKRRAAAKAKKARAPE